MQHRSIGTAYHIAIYIRQYSPGVVPSAPVHHAVVYFAYGSRCTVKTELKEFFGSRRPAGQHSLVCKIGGGVQQRHDNVRDAILDWMKEFGLQPQARLPVGVTEVFSPSLLPAS